MTTMKTLWVMVLVGLWMIPAQARLGETFTECEARYGRYRGSTGEWMLFLKNGINVQAVFSGDQRCVVIRFSGSGTELADGTITALLEANAVDATWKEFDRPESAEVEKQVSEMLAMVGGPTWAQANERGRNWITSDGSRLAVFRDGELFVTTAKMLNEYRAMSGLKATGF